MCVAKTTVHPRCSLSSRRKASSDARESTSRELVASSSRMSSRSGLRSRALGVWSACGRHAVGGTRSACGQRVCRDLQWEQSYGRRQGGAARWHAQQLAEELHPSLLAIGESVELGVEELGDAEHLQETSDARHGGV